MARNQYPMVIVFKEDDDKQYFIANDEIEERKAYAHIALERANDTYYSGYPTRDRVESDYEKEKRSLQKDAELLEITPDAMAALPISVRSDLEAKIKKHQHKVERINAEYEEQTELLDLIEQLQKSDDPANEEYTTPRGIKRNVAKEIISIRSDYQYEGYEICRATVPSV